MNEKVLFNDNCCGDDKIAQIVKTLIVKTDDLIFIPRIRMMTEIT